MSTQNLKVSGMTCGHCAHAVTAALQKVPGVTAVEVRVEHGRARVEGDAKPEALIAAVADAGYGAQALPA